MLENRVGIWDVLLAKPRQTVVLWAIVTLLLLLCLPYTLSLREGEKTGLSMLRWAFGERASATEAREKVHFLVTFILLFPAIPATVLLLGGVFLIRDRLAFGALAGTLGLMGTSLMVVSRVKDDPSGICLLAGYYTQMIMSVILLLWGGMLVWQGWRRTSQGPVEGQPPRTARERCLSKYFPDR